MSKVLTAEAIEEAFADAGPRPSRSLCPVGNIIAGHPALEDKIMDVEHYSSKFVMTVLRRLEFKVSDHSITEHRKGECRCPKEARS